MKHLRLLDQFDRRSIPWGMNSLQIEYRQRLINALTEGTIALKKRNICLCGSLEATRVSQIDRFALNFGTFLCKGCGLVYTSPHIAQESIPHYYKDYYHPLHFGMQFSPENVLFAKRQGKKIFELLKDRLTNNNINVLEVGCGSGSVMKEFVNAAEHQGFTVKGLGIEYSEEYADGFDAAGFNLKVRSGGLEALDSEKGVFDVVIMSHVFEHFVEPDRELNSLRNIIAPNTLIYIEVPGICSLRENSVYDCDYLKYTTGAHVFNYNLISLTHLLNQNGFKILWGNENVESIFTIGEQCIDTTGNYDHVLKYIVDLETNRAFYRSLQPDKLRQRLYIDHLEHVVKENTKKVDGLLKRFSEIEQQTNKAKQDCMAESTLTVTAERNEGKNGVHMPGSKNSLKKLKNKHLGQRCYIIGNGPSLNQMDLSFLKNEITFGMNKIFLLFDKLNFIPDYYVSVNPLVIEQSIDEIGKIPTTKFLSLNGIRYVENPADFIFLKSNPTPHFSTEPAEGIWEGYTVTYVAMQLAYYMGFDEVVLIGVDHYFETQGTPNAEVTSEGDDPNHFHPNYFGKGTRWNLPDLKNSEKAYSMAKSAYENDGRRIIDATYQGKLEIFPKMDYKELVRKYAAIDSYGVKHQSVISHLIQQGETYFEQGRLEEAENAFGKVLSISSKNHIADNNLGALYSQIGKTDQALEHLKRAVSRQPDNITYLKNLADLYYVSFGKTRESLELYIKALALKPDDVEVLNTIAHICTRVERYEDALTFYKKILEMRPSDAETQTKVEELHDLISKRESSAKGCNSCIENGEKYPKEGGREYLVSAIVSCYNSAKFLSGCIEDLEAQTISDRIEIIVVDSGSEQNEADIVREYQKQYDNIRYLRTENRETVYAAWNRGIGAAQGKYITNANTDDRHRGDAFEVMVQFLECLPEIALVYADVVITETENETFEKCTPVGYYRWLNWNRHDLLHRGCFMGPQPMWRREIHREYGLFDESFITSGDYEFWLRISQTNDFMRIPAFLGLYLRSQFSIEHANREKQKIENEHILKMYQEAFAAKKIIRRWGRVSESGTGTLSMNQASENMEAKQTSAIHSGAGQLRGVGSPASRHRDGNEDTGVAGMLENDPDLTSIIVMLSGRQKHIKRCISGIYDHTEPPYELILVDVDAGIGTRKWAEKQAERHGHVQIIRLDDSTALPAAINHACQKANGRNIAILHNDAVVGRGWLAEIIACIDADENVGVVAPMAGNTKGKQGVDGVDGLTRTEFDEFLAKFSHTYRHRRIPVKNVEPFCLVFRKDLLQQIGPFDENFQSEPPLVEDFCLRATLMGYQHYLAGSVCLLHADKHAHPSLPSSDDETKNRDWAVFNAKWDGFEAEGPVRRAMVIEKMVAEGRKLFLQGKLDPAVEAFLNGIATFPTEGRLYTELAHQLKVIGKFKQALDTLAEMPSTDGISGRKRLKVIMLKGFCEEGLGHCDQAEILADETLAIEAENASALNLKGILAFKRGEIEAAEKYFERSHCSDPGYGEACTNMGVLLWDRGEKEIAFKWLQKGFILDPLDLEMSQLFHTATTELNQFNTVEEFVREAAMMYPDSKRLQYFLIDILVRQNKYDEAMAVIENSIVAFGFEDGILDSALCVRKKVKQATTEQSSLNGPAVSLCMIVRNEERDLARCLHSVKPIVDEMVVVDTGSSDRTKDIAAIYGATVYDFEWIDDFAAARNYSLTKASGDWIFIMDADEVVSAKDYEAFERIVSERPESPQAYSIVTRNYNDAANIVGWVPNSGGYESEEAGTGWLPSHKVRLFTRHEQIRFEGKVHEMVDPVLKRMGIKSRHCSIPVHHYGRLNQEKLRQKGEKYYRIGIEKLAQTGDEIGALRELATQAGILNHHQEAVELWQRFLRLDLRPDQRAEALVNMGTAYSKLGQYQDAFEVSKTAVETDPQLKETHYNYAMAALHLKDARTAVDILETLLDRVPHYLPALFILTVAYCCCGQRLKFIEGLAKLKRSFMGQELVRSFSDMAKGLISAGNERDAVLLVQAAIENKIADKELAELYSLLQRQVHAKEEEILKENESLNVAGA